MSNWGKVRRIHAEALQVISDQLTNYWLNLDPNTVLEEDFPEWEYMLGLPVGAGSRELEFRRALILNRMVKGPFTRTRRLNTAELIITSTAGSEVRLTPDGVLFPVDGSGIIFSAGSPGFTPQHFGVPLSSEGISLEGEGINLQVDFYINEFISEFRYEVFVAASIGVDTVTLERELAHITPGGIDFTITVS